MASTFYNYHIEMLRNMSQQQQATSQLGGLGGLLGQQAIRSAASDAADALRYGLSVRKISAAEFYETKPKSYRDELQAEIDEWLNKP